MGHASRRCRSGPRLGGSATGPDRLPDCGEHGSAHMEVSEVSNRILASLLEQRTGQQLAPSRRWRIGSALSGLFREHGISTVDQLIALLTQSREASLARRVVE